MTNYRNIKNYIKITFFCLLALFWIGVFIYFRFYVSRPSYDLHDVKNLVNSKYLLIHLVFILLHVCLIIYAFHLLYKNNNQENIRGKMMTYIHKITSFVFVKPFEYLRDLIAPYIPYSGIIFCNLGNFFENNLSFLNKFVFIFNFIPRIALSCLFFAELIFFQRISYFIMFIPLLLVPTLWNLFLSLFTNFGKRALEDIPNIIKVIPIGEMLPNGWYKKYTFEPLDKYEYGPNDIQEYSILWYGSINIYGFGLLMKSYQIKITPYVILWCSSLYIVATLYKLLFLLF